MQVSIIIVNYNTKEHIRNCLNSIYEKTQDINFEVIVSDNGSTDDSIKMIKTEFPQAILIENNANLGFGTANNRGLEIAKGEFVFYLNSDTVLLNNAVKIFYDYWKANDDGTFGVLGCNLLDKDGNINGSHNYFRALENPTNYIYEIFVLSFKVWCKTFLHIFGYKFKTIHNDHKQYFGEINGYIVGADLFLKNNDFAKFDENIFMYCDEVDLQWKMKINNLKRFLIKGPEIIHYEGASDFTNKEIREVLDLGRFGNINTKANTIYLLKKYNAINLFQTVLLKTATLLLWLNPLLFKNTKKHIKRMLTI